MWFGIVSLFPEIFQALHYGITGRAIETGLAEINYWQPRDFSDNKHRRVDDRPYGGGPGMVMQVAPLRAAIKAAKTIKPQAITIHLSPQGRPLTQDIIQALSKMPALILVSSRYEGVDQRLIDRDIDLEYSIGDYVISGGELASLVLMDAIIRCLPGALGHQASAQQDSFSQGLLDYPHYTRPECIDNQEVPLVLQQGNHHAIDRWRLKQSLGRTWQKRPELLANKKLSTQEQALLEEYIKEYYVLLD